MNRRMKLSLEVFNSTKKKGGVKIKSGGFAKVLLSLTILIGLLTMPAFTLAKDGRGARLILRLDFGKMTAYEVSPKSLPAIAQNQRAKGKNSLSTLKGPSHARFFHSSTNKVLTGGLYHPTSDREMVLS